MMHGDLRIMIFIKLARVLQKPVKCAEELLQVAHINAAAKNLTTVQKSATSAIRITISASLSSLRSPWLYTRKLAIVEWD